MSRFKRRCWHKFVWCCYAEFHSDWTWLCHKQASSN